ncbi:MAG: caspase family protein [Campylobacterota bacterium]|nr:caspase family protein [Campylobacterota bacterium]
MFFKRFLLIGLLFLSGVSYVFAQNKIALLIGNDDYSFSPLSNPLNDVDGIVKTLSEIGFKDLDIKVIKNASKSKMETALANFSEKARNAEIALVYFSGHGMQVNNTNYMLPAKTNPQKPVDLFGLVDLDYFIQSATSAKYGIVLVDACRDNPLIKYFQNGKHKGASAKKGLGQVTPTDGQVVIGFATSAGDTADDGTGNMSPYATALSNRLKENDDIRNILGKVANDVSKKYEQSPIYRANLASSVFLRESYGNQIILPTDLSLKKSVDGETLAALEEEGSNVLPVIKLRHGYSYNFFQRFQAKSQDIGINKVSGTFSEKNNYNGKENPKFDITSTLKEKKYILKKRTVSEIIFESKSKYSIHYFPKIRANDNIVVKYNVTYYAKIGNEWIGPRKKIDIQPYKITWCGDGIIDNYIDRATNNKINEICEPKDESHTNWGTAGCSTICTPLD